ncbi:MAG: ATPase domain-containing protein [Patescibacteria group bacterium]|nr:ATPase domain-containing protein [Patescibacteria group bacterium]
MKSPKRDSCDILCQMPEGSCILFITPPILETRILGMQFLQCGFNNNIPGMFISLNDSPEMLKSKGKSYGFDLESYEKKGMIKWIDGYSAKSKIKVSDTASIKRIPGALALTDISIFLSNVTSSFLKKSKSFKVFFDSISTLTLYNSNDTIFRFLEVITARIKANKGIGLFVLVNDMHDMKFVNTIRQMMDGTMSLDEDSNLKIISFPKIIEKKNYKLSFTEKGIILN